MTDQIYNFQVDWISFISDNNLKITYNVNVLIVQFNQNDFICYDIFQKESKHNNLSS